MAPSARKASDVVTVIETETIPEARAELEVNLHRDPLVVFFVSVKYSSPLRPFHAGSGPGSLNGQHREWEEAFETVMAWLRAGSAPAAAGRKLRRMQRWEWGAITTDLSSLERELESRYELSEAEPETELGWDRIPGGIVVTCEVLMRGSDR
jgi:hypothetical protein